MNIHEHQAKQILKEFGIEVPNGVFALSVEDLIKKAKQLKIPIIQQKLCRENFFLLVCN